MHSTGGVNCECLYPLGSLRVWHSGSKCIACGMENPISRGKLPLQPNNSRFSVLECSHCGLQWCDPMPTPVELEAYYHTYYQRKKSNSPTHIKNALIKNVLERLGWYWFRHLAFVRLINRYRSEGMLLDYGCGEGQMLRTARKDGWTVIGVDYSSETTDRLRADGFDIRCAADLSSSRIPRSSIDCLVAKHVIEHIVDLKQFLSDCRDVLKPQGIMAIKTPSRTSVRARLRLANWHFVNPPEHQWGFQPHCFRLLMESHGFEVVYLENSLIVDELVSIVRVR